MALQARPSARALPLALLLGLCWAAAAGRAPNDPPTLAVELQDAREGQRDELACEDRAFRKCAARGNPRCWKRLRALCTACGTRKGCEEGA